MPHFTDIGTIRNLYQPGHGRHWFDAGSTRFFRTRYPQGGYTTDDGTKTFFVTSECGSTFSADRGMRRYTVRVALAPANYTRMQELRRLVSNGQQMVSSCLFLGINADVLQGHRQELNSMTVDPWEIETVEPFNALTRSVANKRAQDLAAGKLALVYEDYKNKAKPIT